MRVFKRHWFDADKSERQTSDKWYVAFADHNGITRALAAFDNKRSTDELAKQLERLRACCEQNERPDKPLVLWLKTLPPRIRKNLLAWQMIDAQRDAGAKALSEHVADFRTAVAAKRNTGGHVKQIGNRVDRIITECKWARWSDISASKVQAKLAEWGEGTKEAPGISAQTVNFYLQAIKQFAKWMVKDGRASESPVDHLDMLNVRTDRRHDRRALTVDELRRLLDTTEHGTPGDDGKPAAVSRNGVSGPDRALLYRLAVESGLRAGELRSLTRASFALEADPPTVTVAAAYSKRRRDDTLPLRAGTVELLRAHLANKAPAAPAFAMPSRDRLAAVLRADLEAARAAWIAEAGGDAAEREEREASNFLRYRDDAGRVADFHALRHTFITNLANGGVHPKVAQSLARHSTITLTMDRYSHRHTGNELAALDVLPDLSMPATALATGTAGHDGTMAGNATPATGARAVRPALSTGNHLASGQSRGQAPGAFAQAPAKALLARQPDRLAKSS